jgi:DNA polymerase-3 subunit delta
MSKALDALDFLSTKRTDEVPPVCVVFGEEAFLRQLVKARLRSNVLGDDDGEFSLSVFEGDAVSMRDVRDELATVALFGGGRRLVVVEDADDFVSQYRRELEDYCDAPLTTGVLILDVRSFPKNTRLFKIVAKNGLAVECTCPPEARLAKWLIGWTKTRHDAVIEPAAASLLIEITGPELGLLDQEISKLVAYAGPGKPVTASMVEELVGGWRTKTAWNMLDAALDGKSAEALVQLDRLLTSGENPIGLLAQISASLRRFAAAARVVQRAGQSRRRVSLRDALQTAGVRPFALGQAERQLRRLGSKRAGEIYRRLLEADLALKGESSQPARARIVLEQLIITISA